MSQFAHIGHISWRLFAIMLLSALALGAQPRLSAAEDVGPVPTSVSGRDQYVLIEFSEPLVFTQDPGTGEYLDGPAATDFKVRLGQDYDTFETIAVEHINLGASESGVIELVLASPLPQTGILMVDYVRGTNLIKDADGNASWSYYDLEGTLWRDRTGPQFVGASAQSSTLTASYDEKLDRTGVPWPSAFVVTVDSERRDVTEVRIDGANVILTLASPLLEGQEVTYQYVRDESVAMDLIRDAFGNGASPMEYAEWVQNRTDTTAPAIQSAILRNIDHNGTALSVLTLTFDEGVVCAADGDPAPADFTVTNTASGDAVSLRPGDMNVAACSTRVGWMGAGGGPGLAPWNTSIAVKEEVRLTLSSVLTASDTLAVSYNPASGHPISDYAANAISVSPSPYPVTNEVGIERTSDYLWGDGLITSDTEGNGASAVDPIEASITMPSSLEGTVTITETATTDVAPSGYSYLGQQVDIMALDGNGDTLVATADDPFVLTLSLDSSIVENQDPDSILIFRNGEAIPDCATLTNGLTLDGDVACVFSRAASGDDLAITVHTLKFSTWAAGVAATAYELDGFAHPVDMTITNSVKAGATVPLKFEVFEDGTELTTTEVVQSLLPAKVDCSTMVSTTDAVEVTTSGSTSLRYDETSGQFVYNWKTPNTAGCYKVAVTTTYGSTLEAAFKLK